MPGDVERFLFLGVAGMGMAPLALYLLQSGKTVYGHDKAPHPEVMQLLLSRGLKECKTSAFFDNIDVIVHTAAIGDEDPLLESARKRGIPVYRRGAFLAQLAQKKHLIAIVGSHGKTTTTALAISLVHSLELPWEFVLGGFFQFQGTKGSWLPSRFTGSPWMIAEVDESDGTIEDFSPAFTVILNYDWDHPTQYKTAHDFKKCLARLISRTTQGLLISQEDETLRTLATQHATCPWRNFGRPPADYTYQATQQHPNLQSVTIKGPVALSCNSLLALAGAFNAANATAALGIVSWARGASTPFPSGAFESFPGLERRQHLLFDSDNLTVYSDYAHHPTELEAFLQNILSLYPHKTPWVLFEPHRYTRTRTYLEDFVRIFKKIPNLALLDVYPASEPHLPGGDTPALIEHLPHAQHLKSPQHVLDYLHRIPESSNNALVLLTGAGLLDRIAQPWVASLK